MSNSILPQQTPTGTHVLRVATVRHPARQGTSLFGRWIGAACQFGLALFCALMLVLATALQAQIGNNNPTGPAGMFNGNVTTGCSYDPLTGNATRSITDLVVSGSVGSYPLAFARTANSRYQQEDDFAFGPSGGWQHSYSWTIEDSDPVVGINSRPSSYAVHFPDGRAMTFFAAAPPRPLFPRRSRHSRATDATCPRPKPRLSPFA
jgi:hypothetical protein